MGPTQMKNSEKLPDSDSAHADITPSRVGTHSTSSENYHVLSHDARRVIQAATDLSRDVQSALMWYRNEQLPPFNFKTAEQLVTEGRTDAVLRYTASLEAGAAG